MKILGFGITIKHLPYRFLLYSTLSHPLYLSNSFFSGGSYCNGTNLPY